MTEMRVTHAVPADVPALAALEALCFPAAEAASEETLRGRVQAYGNHFYLLHDRETLVSFIDGLCTDQPDLTDDLVLSLSELAQKSPGKVIMKFRIIDPEKRKTLILRSRAMQVTLSAELMDFIKNAKGMTYKVNE